jgi:hypothetical protein
MYAHIIYIIAYKDLFDLYKQKNFFKIGYDIVV